ncbi:MAG: thiamine pyrophosphate-binding protein, partial [Terracidiphilus sp.]
MAATAGDILVDTLHHWGVEVVFGFPGDGINGVIEALRKRQDDIRFIQVRHEEAAAFMACAYAKWTGKLGCCIATSGPGGIHLLNGLYDAKLDGAPVIAITGLQFHDLLDTHTQQDVELDKLYMDVAAYNARVMGPAHTENVVELACRTALARRSVSHVTIPVDVQEKPVEKSEASPRNVAGHVTNVFSASPGMPEPDALARAADILNAGRKIVILAGRGAIGAGDELEQVAEVLGAVIAKPLLGKMAVPDNSPYTTGGVGLLGTAPSQEALESCDTLLIVGSSFPYIEYYPKPKQARCVQIDIEAQRISLRYPAEIGIVADAKLTLKGLLPLLRRNAARGFLESSQKAMKQWWTLMEERGTRSDKPMKPQVVAWELGKRLRDNAIFCSDSGTIATWYARQIPVRRGQMCSLSGNLATMANGLPYAIAAQV